MWRFDQRYENRTIDDWKHVIFSDETKINRYCSNGRSWCWIEDGDRIGPQHVYQIVKHDGGSMMIWGCMMAFGQGAWYIIEGRMDRPLYKFYFRKLIVVHYIDLQFGSK